MLPGLRIVKRLEQQNKKNKLQCSLANWLFLAEASKKECWCFLVDMKFPEARKCPLMILFIIFRFGTFKSSVPSLTGSTRITM